MLAGIDKTLADLVGCKLSKEKVIQRCTFYGLYYLPHTDECEVYKFNIELGKKTVAYKGLHKLAVSDAFNRVLYELKSN